MADLLPPQLTAGQHQAHVGRRYAGGLRGLRDGAVESEVHVGSVSPPAAARQSRPPSAGARTPAALDSRGGCDIVPEREGFPRPFQGGTHV
jgi:hypothetical protein